MGDVHGLNDKVAERGVEIKCLGVQSSIGVTVWDKRQLETQAGNMDDVERGQQRTTHQVFPNLPDQKEVGECENFAGNAHHNHVLLHIILLLVGDGVG